MKTIAVITGDVIESKLFSQTERDKLVEILDTLDNTLRTISKTKTEIFRGDSFQIRVYNPFESLRIAIAVRALFRSNTFLNSNKQWDVRLSLGIGQSQYEMENVGTSDGEAYRFSGYGLDNMTDERLHIATPWAEKNNEINVETAFADDIISNWTSKQSLAMFYYLCTKESHVRISKRMNISRQSTDRLFKAAKDRLIVLYLNRFAEILKPWAH